MIDPDLPIQIMVKINSDFLQGKTGAICFSLFSGYAFSHVFRFLVSK